LFDGTIVEPTLKHSLSLSAGLALIASAAMYVLAYFLFTIHEEIGISADAACLSPCGPSQSCFWEASLPIWPGKLALADVERAAGVLALEYHPHSFQEPSGAQLVSPASHLL
jgi:hypothetical protein